MSGDRDLLSGEYSTGEVAAAAGVSIHVIADWLKRQLISAAQNPKNGRSRTFSFWNVVEAILVARLNHAIGIRSGALKTVMSLVFAEANIMNTYTKHSGGYADFIVVAKMGRDGLVALYREGPYHRSPWYEDDMPEMVHIHINVGMAIHDAEQALAR